MKKDSEISRMFQYAGNRLADAENEHQIQLAFEKLTAGKTVLMIAHRPECGSDPAIRGW